MNVYYCHNVNAFWLFVTAFKKVLDCDLYSLPLGHEPEVKGHRDKVGLKWYLLVKYT